MKILLVNYEYKPQCGGAGFATYNLAKELVRQGNEVDLLVGWDDRYGMPELLNGVNTYVIKIKKKSVHESSPIGVLEFVIKGTWKMREITKKRYDIIQFFFSIPTGILKYGIRNHIPYICSLRGIDVPSARKDKYAFLRNMLNIVNGNIVNNAAAVTALSEELKRWFNAAYENIEVQVIPNGLDYHLFKKKEKYNEKIKRFVTVARLIDCKNIELSMRAFKKAHEKYPDITLDIMGEGYLHERLQQVITEENMDKYITLRGYVEPEKISQTLCTYDMFYLLTVADSFGQVFIEAMACGLPVICADIGGPKEIVADSVTGIKVEPNNESETVKGIIKAIENPGIMEEYGKKGYERVVEMYSMEGVAQKHLEIYREVIGRKRNV